MYAVLPITLLLLLSTSLSAQNTCYTNSAGTTICSTAGGVVHGNTNSVGNSVYRDERGKQLDLQSNQFGNASLRVDGAGEVRWSQEVIAEKRDPVQVTRDPVLVPPRQSTPTPLFQAGDK
ncbi:MAG: hypothetical protein ABJ013_10475 [Halioglobus sp.]